MTTANIAQSVSRRTALAGIGASGLAVALAARSPSSAQASKGGRTMTDQRLVNQWTIDTADSMQGILDFLVTEEQLGVTLLTAAIQNASGTPSEAFLPVLRNGVATEYHHVEALKAAGGEALTTSYWLPDAAFGDGGIGLFETLEVIETIEISLYLIGVSAFARAGEDYGARLCAEAMGTEAVHRALVRFAQGELGNKDIGAPNDVGFESFDWPTVAKVRQSLEELGIRYGTENRSQPGKFYEYPGDPLASGVGTPVNHTNAT
jgi:hypothetical protein